MEEHHNTDVLFKALADPSRRKLLDLLHANDGSTLNELCQHLNMTRQGVTQHLDLLEAAGSEKAYSRVINIGSIEGIRTTHLEAYSYAASKAGVNHLTRIMAKFLAPKHIAVNAIAPGYFPSKMTDAIDEHGSRQVIEDAPMKRMGAPEDMAGIALYLASRASSFVCGAVIPVDGGLATTA